LEQSRSVSIRAIVCDQQWRNTKYLANNKLQSVKQTFFWADANNKTPPVNRSLPLHFKPSTFG
jgi:hypothetical protein